MGENKDYYKVYIAEESTYSSEGMGSAKYAKMEADDVADAIEEELDIDTYVKRTEKPTFRSYAEGGPYGGAFGVFAAEQIPEEEVERVKESHYNKVMEEI